MSDFCTLESFLSSERSGRLASTIASLNITQRMRSILVGWLYQVKKMFKLLDKTFSLTVAILDAFLAREANLDKKQLQLVGCASMLLASKYNEIYPPEINDIIFISDNIFTKLQIMDMEKQIFVKLGCNINFVTDIDLFRRLAVKNDPGTDAHIICKELVRMMSLISYGMLPSVTVTACRKIASKIVPNEKFVNYFGIPEKDIDYAEEKIISLLKKLEKSNLNKDFNNSRHHISASAWNTYHKQLLDYTCKTATSLSPEYSLSHYFRPNITTNMVPDEVVPKGSPKLGEGTYGVVKKINYKGINYAVKKFRDDHDEGLSQSFIREVSVLSTLDHPNIIKICYITENLKNVLLPLGSCDAKGWYQKNTMTKEIQKKLTDQMFSALSYMEDMGCLHRDVKPQNILVFPTNGSIDFILCDFGLARGSHLEGKVGPAYTHEVCTLWYRPPEILLGQTAYDDRIDVWSMVCTIYEICTKKALFPGDSEIDQLFKIFQTLGLPTEKTWPGVSSLAEYKVFPNWDNKLRLLNNVNSDLLKLIECGLIMDSNKRPTAKMLMYMLEKKISQEGLDDYIKMGVDIGVIYKNGETAIVKNKPIDVTDVLYFDNSSFFDLIRAEESFVDEHGLKGTIKLFSIEQINKLTDKITKSRGVHEVISV